MTFAYVSRLRRWAMRVFISGGFLDGSDDRLSGIRTRHDRTKRYEVARS